MIYLEDNKELGYEVCQGHIDKVIGNNFVFLKHGYYALRTLNAKNGRPIDVIDNCKYIEEFKGIIKYLKDNKFGLIDMDGNIITEPIFTNIIDYINGVAIVKEHKKLSYNHNLIDDNYLVKDTVNLIDISGHFLTHDEYDHIEYIGHGFFKTTLNYKHGLINSQGVKILDPIYINVIAFNKQFVGVIGDKHPFKWSIIDTTNVELSEQQKFRYYCIVFISDNRWLVANRFTKWRIVDNNNNEIKKLNRSYDQVGDFINGYAKVKFKKKYGLIDGEGNEVIEPIYKNVESLGSNLWKLGFENTEQIKSLYGLIDINGKDLQLSKYQLLEHLDSNHMLVTKSPKKSIVYQIYNTKTHLLSNTQYKKCEKLSNDLVKVDEGLGTYLINQNQDILSDTYFDINDFEYGIAKVFSRAESTEKLINEEGKELGISYSSLHSLVDIKDNLISKADLDFKDNNLLYTLYNVEGEMLLEFRAVTCHIISSNQIIIDNYLYNLEDLLKLENTEFKVKAKK